MHWSQSWWLAPTTVHSCSQNSASSALTISCVLTSPDKHVMSRCLCPVSCQLFNFRTLLCDDCSSVSSPPPLFCLPPSWSKTGQRQFAVTISAILSPIILYPHFCNFPTVTTCATPFSFYSIIKSQKSQQSVKYREELGATWKWAHILVAQPGQIWGSKLTPKIVLKTILTRSGPIHHFLFGNQKLRCFDNCVSTQATAVGLYKCF